MEFKKIQIVGDGSEGKREPKEIEIVVRGESGQTMPLAEYNALQRRLAISDIADEVEQQLTVAVERYAEAEIERRVEVIKERLEEQFEERVAAEVERRLEALAERQ